MTPPDQRVEGDAAAFQLQSVVDAYPLRAPYPPATFEFLASLLVEPRHLLDLGTGDGTIARPMANLADAVHAIDPSAAMLAAARGRPGGDQPNIRWVLGTAEATALDGPYGLVTAAASWHWMDGGTVLRRLAPVLAAGAFIALLWDNKEPAPWTEELTALLGRFVRSRGSPTRPGIDALIEQGLYESQGREQIPSARIRQSVDAYIAQIHATAMANREWMGYEASELFDAEAQDLLSKYAENGVLEFDVGATVEYGRPSGPAHSSSTTR